MKYTTSVGTLLSILIVSVLDVFKNVIQLTQEQAAATIWESSDESIATVRVDAAGKTWVESTGKAGKATITSRLDTNTSTPEFATVSVEIDYLPGEARTMELTITEAGITDKPITDTTAEQPAEPAAEGEATEEDEQPGATDAGE